MYWIDLALVIATAIAAALYLRERKPDRFCNVLMALIVLMYGFIYALEHLIK